MKTPKIISIWDTTEVGQTSCLLKQSGCDWQNCTLPHTDIWWFLFQNKFYLFFVYFQLATVQEDKGFSTQLVDCWFDLTICKLFVKILYMFHKHDIFKDLAKPYLLFKLKTNQKYENQKLIKGDWWLKLLKGHQNSSRQRVPFI